METIYKKEKWVTWIFFIVIGKKRSRLSFTLSLSLILWYFYNHLDTFRDEGRSLLRSISRETRLEWIVKQRMNDRTEFERNRRWKNGWRTRTFCLSSLTFFYHFIAHPIYSSWSGGVLYLWSFGTGTAKTFIERYVFVVVMMVELFDHWNDEREESISFSPTFPASVLWRSEMYRNIKKVSHIIVPSSYLTSSEKEEKNKEWNTKRRRRKWERKQKRWAEKTVGPTTDSTLFKPLTNSHPFFPSSSSRHWNPSSLATTSFFSFFAVIISLSFNSSGIKAAGTELRAKEKIAMKTSQMWTKEEKRESREWVSLSSNFRIEVLSSVTRSLETIDSLSLSPNVLYSI